MNNLAPIVLFVYNRPWHTQQTLEALAKNELAKESILYIYADGPKVNANEETIEKIKETRACLKKEQWCKEVVIIERESNVGLAKSIINGVSEVVNKHGKVIVLEDDLVTSSGFLEYINSSLNLYEEHDVVMHIAGYIPSIETTNEPETFFYNETSCWGWGTWKRAWKYFDCDSEKMLAEIKQNKRLFEFDMEGAYPFSTHLRNNSATKILTWAINWHASVFLKNGLSLHPKQSLVLNIGMDASGVNSGNTALFNTKLAPSISITFQSLMENKSVRIKIKEFYFECGYKAIPESPLTGSTNVALDKIIDSKDLISRYKINFDLDVSSYFKGKPHVFIFRCLDTGFRFYYPYGIDGNALFYAHFQKFDWYYMPWKWEHECVKEKVSSIDKVLEIGCGPASFVKKLTQENIECTGLELNKDAVQMGRKEGLNVFNESIQQHAINHRGEYDVVCSFQVMEHIEQIREVLNSSIDCLKVGGKLFISVPNNNSFLGLDHLNVLNQPPHHMGLWDRKSLYHLQRFFPLRLDDLFLEPPQIYHKEYCTSIINSVMSSVWANKFGVVGKLFRKILRPFNLKIMKYKFPEIQNLTIIAQYTKL